MALSNPQYRYLITGWEWTGYDNHQEEINLQQINPPVFNIMLKPKEELNER